MCETGSSYQPTAGSLRLEPTAPTAGFTNQTGPSNMSVTTCPSSSDDSASSSSGVSCIFTAFAVECRDVEESDRVFVVGSPMELGSWDPEASMVELHTTPHDYPLWRSEWHAIDVDVLPQGSGFDYKYVVMRGGNDSDIAVDEDGWRVEPCIGAEYRWESRSNRSISYDSSALKETANRHISVIDKFNSPPAEDARRRLLVRFAVECQGTSPGDKVVVVGGAPALGDWVPAASSIEMCTGPADFPLWRSGWVVVDFESLARCTEAREYKYVVIHADSSLTWESRPNRHLPWRHDRSEDIKVAVNDVFGCKNEGAFRFEHTSQGHATPSMTPPWSRCRSEGDRADESPPPPKVAPPASAAPPPQLTMLELESSCNLRTQELESSCNLQTWSVPLKKVATEAAWLMPPEPWENSFVPENPCPPSPPGQLLSEFRWAGF